MEYKYDPILCMNVPVEKKKVHDASWKAWTLYIDGKWVKSFNSSMAPIKEAQKFMKENYPGKVGKLTRNTGSSSGYSISGNEYKDEAPAEVRDVDTLKKGQIYRNKNGVTVEIISVESNYVLADFGGQKKDFTPVGLQKILSDNGYKKVRDVNKYEEAAAKMLKEGKSGTEIIFALQRMGLTPVDAAQYYGAAKLSSPKIYDSLDKALKTCDKFTVWESDDYDDIYVSYENGTYVLYVDGRPQADGPQQRMIQLAKQEERVRD